MNLLELNLPQIDSPCKLGIWIQHREEELRDEMRLRLQSEVQSQIAALESSYKGVRQHRQFHLHTGFGTIELRKRVYRNPEGKSFCPVDACRLPVNGWLPHVLELASALGVSMEFQRANELFTKWTMVKVSEKTLANQVENQGMMLIEEEKERLDHPTYGIETALTRQVCAQAPRVYVEMDGIMTPLNRGQRCREARVGVIFWEDDLWQLSPKRKWIKAREYVATLDSWTCFASRLRQRYTEVVKEERCQTLILGDGAKRIWRVADEEFPEAIQILDFYHLSEYVWAIARGAWPNQVRMQEDWVKIQLDRLKDSNPQDVLESLKHLPRTRDRYEACKRFKSYIRNNAHRMDYKRYLAEGYMIGSGVIESSNRRIVTQRLKQAGMHWSWNGANSVMALRACYLSSSDHWENRWNAVAA